MKMYQSQQVRTQHDSFTRTHNRSRSAASDAPLIVGARLPISVAPSPRSRGRIAHDECVAPSRQRTYLGADRRKPRHRPCHGEEFSAGGWRVITVSRQLSSALCPGRAATRTMADRPCRSRTMSAADRKKFRDRAGGGRLYALVNNAAISPRTRPAAASAHRHAVRPVAQVVQTSISSRRGAGERPHARAVGSARLRGQRHLDRGSRVHPFAGSAYATSRRRWRLDARDGPRITGNYVVAHRHAVAVCPAWRVLMPKSSGLPENGTGGASPMGMRVVTCTARNRVGRP